MARPSIPDPEKRVNVGLRLHPGTLQRLDEIVALFQGLRRLNPMLPFGYPESRTDVVEFLLREGVREVIDHVLAWKRIGTQREKPEDLTLLGQSAFWNTLISEARLQLEVVPDSWLEREWPPVSSNAEASSAKASSPMPKTPPSKSCRKPRKP